MRRRIWQRLLGLQKTKDAHFKKDAATAQSFEGLTSISRLKIVESCVFWLFTASLRLNPSAHFSLLVLRILLQRTRLFLMNMFLRESLLACTDLNASGWHGEYSFPAVSAASFCTSGERSRTRERQVDQEQGDTLLSVPRLILSPRSHVRSA